MKPATFRRRGAGGLRRYTLSLEMAEALLAAHRGAGLHNWGGGFWLPMPPPSGYWKGDQRHLMGATRTTRERYYGTRTVDALLGRELVTEAERASKTPGLSPLLVAVAVTDAGRSLLDMLPAIAPAEWPDALRAPHLGHAADVLP